MHESYLNVELDEIYNVNGICSTNRNVTKILIQLTGICRKM